MRRATYVKAIRQSAAVLLADAGGAPGGDSAYDRLKFEALLRGEMEMQTAAHNVGAAEAELGPQSLKELNDKLKGPLITTNLRDEQGNEFLPTHRIVSVGGQRIAVAGVLSRQYASSNLQIDDPYESLMKLIRSLDGQYDELLVLAYLPEDELEVLVTRIPEADLVVGGPTRQTIAPKRAGPTVWAATTNRGKFLVHIQRPSSSAPWDGTIVELNEQFSDDAEQTMNLKRFRDDLARIDFTADQTSFAPPLPADADSGFRVAGTQACLNCHADDCQLWSKSGHSHAWRTLINKHASMDPYCQHCHTTGYGLPGGFRSIAAGTQRQNVGCESCHGPAHSHVLQPEIHTIYDAADRCVGCHDHDNSPKFKYDDYWSRIQHGQRVSPQKDD